MITTKYFLLVGVMGCLLSASNLCAETQLQASHMFSNFTLAVERGDYASFALESDEQLRHDIPPTIFRTLHEQLRPRMECGFETRYLGHLEQRGCEVFLWVVTFQDGDDQLLGKLVTKNGKATEFQLQ